MPLSSALQAWCWLLLLPPAAYCRTALPPGDETPRVVLVRQAAGEAVSKPASGTRIVTLRYTVASGDTAWRILTKKGSFRHFRRDEAYALLRQLNPSLDDPALIRPGQELLIPLNPVAGVEVPPPGDARPAESREAPPAAPVAEAGEKPGPAERFETWTMRPGDTLAGVARQRFQVPERVLFREYLPRLKHLNPELGDPNRVFPGHSLRFPLYPFVPTESAAKPVPAAARREDPGGDSDKTALVRALGAVLSAMGEEWVDRGEHFIPLHSGGQIQLRAELFPMLKLASGLRLVLDLGGRLAPETARLIRQNWANYRVVRIQPTEDLRSALGEVFSASGYEEVPGLEEGVQLRDGVVAKITAGWVLQRPAAGPGANKGLVVLYLGETPAHGLDRGIGRYLLRNGIRVVEHPPAASVDEEAGLQAPEAPWVGRDPRAAVETLLASSNLGFYRKIDIPVYRSQPAKFTFTVSADFFLSLGGQDAIISLTRLSPAVLTFLQRHRFRALSLEMGREPALLVREVLRFLDVPFQEGLHDFPALSDAEKGGQRKVALSLPGILLPEAGPPPVFLTMSPPAEEIESFLGEAGYRVLRVPAQWP